MSTHARRSLAIALGAALTSVTTSSCTHDSTSPQGRASLAIVTGAMQRDTIDAILSQALVVEVRSVDGRAQSGIMVQFTAVPAANSARSAEAAIRVAALAGSNFEVSFLDSTDVLGRAKGLVRLGSIVGDARIAVFVPSLGLRDTVSYTVAAGQAARIIVPVRDTTIGLEARVSIRARAQDRYGNERTDDVARYSVASSGANVDAAGTVTGIAPSRVAIAVQFGAVVDSFHVSIVPHGTITVVAQAGSTAFPTYQVATVDLDGSHFRAIAPVAGIHADPHWSPLGDRIVFGTGAPVQGAGLFTVDLAGNRQSLTAPLSDLTEERFAHYSPDGAWVYFARIRLSPGRADLYRVRPDGSALELLRPVTVRSVIQSEPSLSPDGTTLAYMDGAFIRLMNVTTRAVTSLDVVGRYPQFSPDGRHLAYLNDPFGLLRLMALDGSDQHPITTAQQYTEGTGSFSKDGQWIVIRAPRGVQLVRVSDGAVIPLPFAQQFFQPSFKP